MFKTVLKCFAALWCGLIALFVLPVTQIAAPQTIHAQALLSSAGNPTVTFVVEGSTKLTGHGGTKLTITGQGFQPDQGNSVTLYATTDVNGCVPGGPNLFGLDPNPAIAPIAANGTFTFDARWPHTTNNAPPEDAGTAYHICALSTQGEKAASSKAFTVGQPLTATVSKDALNPGDQVTVNGENWLPPLPVTISIVSAAAPDQAIAQQTVTPNANGKFSVALTLDGNAQPGSYTLHVETADDPQGPQYTQENVLTVNAPVTPTPGATPTPTPTPTAAPTSTPTPTPPGNNSGSGGGSPVVTILIFTLGGMGLLMVITGLIMFAAAAPPKTGRIS